MDNEAIAEFFASTPVHIHGNSSLREPQKEGYRAIAQHFEMSGEPCYVQLPVGSGKTGLIGITPFGLSRGRVLIVTPDLTVRSTIMKELDITDPHNFFAKRGVLRPKDGPFLAELRKGANIHDCDNAHFIVANIQQFAGENNRWYEKFPCDYFSMVLVDEGHHNVAATWTRLFDYFKDARVVSYTATPIRADGEQVLGKRIYSFGYRRSMMLGMISPIDAVFVAPTMLRFTAEGKTREFDLDEVLQMRTKDWFSKGIALSDECNRHIVQASIRQLHEVRRHGSPRQIIAATCSIRHAVAVKALYHEHGLKAEVLHSGMDADERERVEQGLRAGLLDVVVQVRMLGEGYSLGSLSVAAVFRPYRSLSPYIQFVGRILRLANPSSPTSEANRVYLVSHVGLNDGRWWDDFTNFDDEDADFFKEYLAGNEEGETVEGGGGQPRLTLRPFMRVLTETVDKYVQRAFLKEVDETMVSEILDTIRGKGYDPLEFGLTAEMVRARLELARNTQLELPAYEAPIQPQRRREALRQKLYQEGRSIADVVVNRLGLSHGGGDLRRHFPGRGTTNSAILIRAPIGLNASDFDPLGRGIDSAARP
jgi:DNA repair protein RadD